MHVSRDDQVLLPERLGGHEPVSGMSAPDTRSNAARVPQVQQCAALCCCPRCGLRFSGLLQSLASRALAGSRRPSDEERAERVCKDEWEDSEGGMERHKRAWPHVSAQGAVSGRARRAPTTSCTSGEACTELPSYAVRPSSRSARPSYGRARLREVREHHRSHAPPRRPG